MANLYGEKYYKNYGSVGLEMDYESEHFKLFFMGIAKKIVADFSPQSVLDVGCAWGYLVSELRDLGVEAYGIDISPYAISRVREEVKPFCALSSATSDLPAHFPNRYDLVVSIETLEHMHEEESLAVIGKMCSYSDKVIISSSPDDITEPTHFNVQQPEYWAKRFATNGFFKNVNYRVDYISKDAALFERSNDVSRVVENYERSMRLMFNRFVGEESSKTKKADLIVSALYLDVGKGFEEDTMIEVTVSGNCFRYQMNVMSNLSSLRFDPLDGIPCVVYDLKVTSNNGSLIFTNLNGCKLWRYDFFLTKDPQFEIKIPTGTTWVLIEASIYPIPVEDTGMLVSVNEMLKYRKEQKMKIRELIQETKEYQVKILELDKEADKLQDKIIKLYRDSEESKAKVLELNKEAEECQAKIQELNHEAEVRQFKIIQLGKEACVSQTKIQELNNGAEKLQDKNNELCLILRATEARLMAIQNSTFWSLTKPVRVSLDFIKFFLKNFPLTGLLYKGLRNIKHNGFKATWHQVKRRLFVNQEKQAKKITAKAFDLSEKESLTQRTKIFPMEVKFSIITPLFNTPKDFLTEMLDSVLNQTYQNWELCLVDGSDNHHRHVEKICETYVKKDKRVVYKKLKKNEGISGNTNHALKMATGEYLAMLDHDDIIHPSALYEMMCTICEENADLLYTDEAIFPVSPTQSTPAFKPDYAPDTMRSQNYMTHFCVYSRDLLDKAGCYDSRFDGSQDYDMILRLTEIAKKIAHIPKLLYFWRIHQDSTCDNLSAKPYALVAARKAITEHLMRLDIPALVQEAEIEGMHRVRYEIHGEPLISVIIPNKDHLHDLKICIESILGRTSYKNFEVVIVENNSVSKEIFDYYEILKNSEHIKVVTWNGQFNFSAINNFGVEQANGEYVVLLNNDTEIITHDWLQEMLMFAQREDVGAVGAKLYYKDGTIQHAGVVVGLGGVAGHSHKHFPRDHPGYMGRLKIAQNMSAVTGACIMARRDVYTQVGGLDEKFAVAFNDVDFCMRLRKMRYLVVFTPFAELFHHESKTRGDEDTQQKQTRFLGECNLFRMRWAKELDKGDPYYNPNLTLDREDFSYRV